MDVLLVVVPIVVAIVTGAGSYYIVKRAKSGQIGTSEAETLWAEAEKMRTIYREEAAQLRVEGLALRQEVLGLRQEVLHLRDETAALRKEGMRWREEAIRLRSDVAASRGTEPAPGVLDEELL